MSERRDYIALEWVAGEIKETLDLASQALENYIGNRDDVTKLRFCQTHIHQVQGTLKMVEFFGAALLAEEMEGVVNALLQGSIHDSHVDDALVVLKNSVSQLPLYLERVRESRHGLPATLLPVLNDLRSVRGENLVSESALFVPDMSGQPKAHSAPVLAVTGRELGEVTRKLRQMFQIALLGLIRNRELKKNVNYLAKVCARLTKLTNGCLSQPLWRICIAVLEGLLNGSIDPSVSIKILLRQVDREIKVIIDRGESALLEAPPEKLVKNLLYYVARSKAHSRYIQDIKKEYQLETSLLGEGELEDDSLVVPDDAVLGAVVDALSLELSQIKRILEDDTLNPDALSEALPLFRRVCDTMAVLGMGKAMKLVQDGFSQLAKVLATKNSIEETDLEDIVAAILSAEEELGFSDIVSKTSEEKTSSRGESHSHRFDHNNDDVVRESRKNLEQAKESIVEFVATQWNHNTLTAIPYLLNNTYEQLSRIPLLSAAKVVRACGMFVSQDLLQDKQVPEWQMLDTLADAITSIDYYLERIADDSESESEAILEVAADSVAELGYPIELLTEEEVSNTEYSTQTASEGEASGNSTVESPDLDDSSIEPLAAEIAQSAPEIESLAPEKVQSQEESGAAEIPILTHAVVDEGPTGSVSEVDETEEDEDEIDPEIIEIFVEEAGEVLEAIEESLPQWKMNWSEEESRSTVRRAFHTLKGSGRMVGAHDIGELAWSIENMLNRINDGSIDIDDLRFSLIDEVIKNVPSMVAAFEHKKAIDKPAIEHLINCANTLSNEQSPSEPINIHYEAAFEKEVDKPGADVRFSLEAEKEKEEEETSIDAELVDIFSAEATSHAKILEQFIDHCKELAGPAELTDELQRALHTLKGSANMAGIVPVAEVVTPIERLVRELRASQLKVESPVVELLARGLALINAGIDQLYTGPVDELPGAEKYIDEVEKLSDERLDYASDEEQEDNGIPPEALNNFLGDGLDIISEISDSIPRWQENGSNSLELKHCEKEIIRFVDHAKSINMLALAELGAEVARFYARSVECEKLDDDFFQLALAGNDALIDMLDQIAGHQDPTVNTDVLSDLQNFQFPSPSPSPSPSSGFDLNEYITAAETNAGNGGESPDVIPEESNSASLSASVEAVYGELIDTIYQNESEGDQDFDLIDLDNDPYIERDIIQTETDPEPDGNTDSVIESAFAGGAEPELEGDVDSAIDLALASEVEPERDIDSTIDDLALASGTEREPEDDIESAIDLVFASGPESNPEQEQEQEPLRAQDVELAEKLELKSELEQEDREPDTELKSDKKINTDLLPEPATDAAATRKVESEEDEIDAEIVEIFLDEADDLLEDLDNAIHLLGQNRGERGALNELLRTLHTLKGGARMAGLTAIGDLSHDFETALIRVDNENAEIGDDFFAQIQRNQDELITQISAVKNGEKPGNGIDKDLDHDIAERTDDENTEENVEPDLSEIPPPVSEVVDNVETASVLESEKLDLELSSSSTVSHLPQSKTNYKSLDRPPEKIDSSGASSQQEMVKVPAQLLEELVNLAGETSISRGRAEEQMSDLVFSLDEMQITAERLQEQVRRLDMETEQQILYRQEQVESEGLEGFDPLEMDRYSQLQQLSRSLLESSSDLIDIKNTLSDKSRDMETLLVQQSRINTDLQEGLLRSRMVPFQRLVPRLRRIVRQVSSELKKNVELQLDNIEGELDRAVLDRMIVPLEHMLRNAVDHGIESAEGRIAAGKPEKGSISLDLSREGGEIVLKLSDDGGGINLEKIKAKAIEGGAMDADADLTDYEILQFILHSGISTAAAVTQISGRGVGMDVVNSEIKQLGGSMEIQSEFGVGTQFVVRLPFTVSVNRALMVTIGGDSFAIPLNTIEGIVRVSPYELEAYYQPEAPLFEYAGQPYVMRYMGSLLQRGEKPNLEGQSMPLPVLLARGAEHSVAIQVDSLMGSREIVVKPLGPQFSQVQGVTGATVLGDGSVVVILDLLSMIRADLSHVHRGAAKSTNESVEEQSTLVMIVDDSVTVRKVMSRFLERQGMDVLLAKDGVDAVTQLSEIERLPDLMLLDIEMPRMDGFEVASRVRHTNRVKHLPIIMITSRTGDKHRDRAFSLGVDEYMGKPYQESELLEKIIKLTGRNIEQ